MKNTKILSVILTMLLLAAVLMLAGCKKECQHDYSHVTVSSTCTEKGYTEHTCKKCGDSYKDSYTEKSAHSYNSVVIPATCTAEGYTEHTCTACGDSYKDTLVPVTAHRFNGGDCVYCSFAQPTEAITPDTSWYVEESVVFTLTTKEQLAGLAEIVNGGNSLADTVIYLDSDMDLAYAPWTPIGNAESPFAGTLAGNGHIISHLNISSEGSFIGLFGNVSGILYDFTLDNASVFVKGGNSNVAILCGYSVNKIESVSVYGYVDAKDSNCVGGIVGYTKSVIASCESSAIVTGCEKVGGIAGAAEVSATVFDSLVNNGEISGGNYSGGIFGALLGGSNVVYIDNNVNNGNVSGKGYVGGIVGYAEGKESSLIQSSVCTADISGEYYVGGIAGQAKNVAISSCSNEGASVSASSATLSDDTYYAYLGGYVGTGYSVENCVNSADIIYIARGSYVGGIAGYLSSFVSECSNSGNISGYDYVGGIAGGVATPSSATVINLTNSGDVSGKSKIGGIAGHWSYANPITVGECSNSGAVNGTSYVGGIIGDFRYSSSAILSAYNLTSTGDVIGSDAYVGGLFGYVNGKDSSVVSNSTVSANISGLYVVGGLIGMAENVKLSDSTNDGSTVTATGFVIEGEDTNVYLGGYVGKGYKIQNCINNVDINYTSLGNYVGGIAGKATSEVSNCLNNASIISNASNVGGIAGMLWSNNANSYSNLINNGTINGKDCVGGVAGYLFSAVDWDSRPSFTLSELSNTGNVSGGDMIGGVFGRCYMNNSHWCYGCYGKNIYTIATNFNNSGEINGKTNVGEIAGCFSSDGGSTLDCYTVTGKVIVSNEILEGNYDVGSNTNLTLTNRIAPEVEETTPETPAE